MSKDIGAFDAKTHLSQYLERASRGESFTITRRGVPLADLRPHNEDAGGLRIALHECSAFRSRIGGGPGFNVVEAIREDRER